MFISNNCCCCCLSSLSLFPPPSVDTIAHILKPWHWMEVRETNTKCSCFCNVQPVITLPLWSLLLIYMHSAEVRSRIYNYDWGFFYLQYIYSLSYLSLDIITVAVGMVLLNRVNSFFISSFTYKVCQISVWKIWVIVCDMHLLMLVFCLQVCQLLLIFPVTVHTN